MFCKDCGAEIREAQKFCGNCGKGLASPKAESQSKNTNLRKRLVLWSAGIVAGFLILHAIIPTHDTQPAVAYCCKSDTAELSTQQNSQSPPPENQPVADSEGPSVPVVSSTDGNISAGSGKATRQEPTLTPHQQRLAALREKQEGIEMAMAVEHDTIAKTLREEGPQGVPEDEPERAQRLIQEKEAIDAAIKEEEQEGGSEPEPSPPTVLQTLPHHQVGETFSVGYWAYHCDGMRRSQFLGSGNSQAGRSETGGFAVIYLTMRNEDDSPSIVPPIRLIDSDAREYDTSPKALLQRDALDLTATFDAKASAQGSVIFEVPPGGTYFLEVSGGMMSNQLALIDLGKLGTESVPDGAKSIPTSNQPPQSSAPTSNGPQ